MSVFPSGLPGSARRAFLLLSLALCAVPAVRGQQVNEMAVARELDAFIRRGIREWEIPGLSVAVVHRDSVILLRGYGVRQLGQRDSVDPQTLFGIMSTTKAMTAMAVAMLVDDGRLRWNDPVTRWVPEFAMPDPYLTRELTVEDLLTHNSGLGNADLLWTREDLSQAEIFRRVRLLTPAYSLRGGFIYQNVMYGLAGEVVARASGMSYGEFLRQRIFGPLGMSRSYPSYAAMHALGDPNVSSPHFRIRDTIRVIAEDRVDLLPAAGSVWSTAEDMATWMRFLLDSARVSGRRLVTEGNFRRLFTPHAMIGPEEFYPTARLTRPHWTSYGLGWFQQDYQGRFVAFHTGSLDGRTAIVGLLPDEQVGVYVFGNLDHAEFRHALMFKVFDQYLGGPARDWSADLRRLYGDRRARTDSTRAAAARQRVTGTRPSLALANYAGTYLHPVWGDLVVGLEGDSLVMHMGTGAGLRGPLRHWHYDTFRAELGDGRSDPVLVLFVLGAEGDVQELRIPEFDERGFMRSR
jgi:CubicO group peptidase (beta-lactamase class C family)